MRASRHGLVGAVLVAATAIPAQAALARQELGPPELTATSAEGDVTVPAIRSCWRGPSDERALCADDIPTGAEPVVRIEQGAELALDFSSAGRPTDVRVERHGPSGPPVQTVELGARTRVDARFPLGMHEIGVATSWDQGEAYYLFRAEVSAPDDDGGLPVGLLAAVSLAALLAGGVAARRARRSS